MQVLALLPWYDWFAILWFLAAWAGYAWFSRFWSRRKPSLLAATNRYRRAWMMQAIDRDPRVLDGIIAAAGRFCRRHRATRAFRLQGRHLARHGG